MSGNLKNFYYKKLDLYLSDSDYWDFYLASDETCLTMYDDIISGSCLVAHYDFNNSNIFSTGSTSANTIYSLTTWDDAINLGVSATTWGFTGIDNGQITFTQSSGDTGNTALLSALTASTLVIPSGDTRLVLNSVTGMTGNYIYPIEQVIDTGTTGNYARMCGGFYQGYYKLDGEDYEVLPNRVPKGWTTEFILRKSDLNCSGVTGTTLNDLYPENKGIFFYLGTRAENKFWNIFEGNNTGCTSGCTSDTGCTGTVTTFCTSVKETDVYYEDDETGFMLPLSPPPINITKIENQFLLYGRANKRSCSACGNVESDGLGTYTVCDDISNVYITGRSQTVINTDNKFLTFCRACNSCSSCGGFGCGGVTGGTCTTVCDYTGDTTTLLELDPNLDVFDNALGFRIKDDGSIGYKSLVFTGYCSGDTYITGVTVQEEYSLSGMVQDDEWTKISIRFVLNETYDECELKGGPRRKGKLMFYVGCRLKLVSKEIDEFIARRLIEQNEKQLTVPYNISLGGGSQGLLESMTFDGQDPDDLGMLIEQNYAGTFIGDISQFRFYSCNLSWCDIKNNCFFDDERYDL